MTGGPVFGAFARSSEAPECFDRLVGRLVEELPTLDQLVNGNKGPGTVAWLVQQNLYFKVSNVYHLLLQTDQSFGSFYPSTLKALQSYRDFLFSPSTQFAMQVASEGHPFCRRVPAMFHKVTSVIMNDGSGTMSLIYSDGGNTISWVVCEAKVNSGELPGWSEVESACEDGELRACMGCGVVRYCGRDHQKHDRKYHKLTCIK